MKIKWIGCPILLAAMVTTGCTSQVDDKISAAIEIAIDDRVLVDAKQLITDYDVLVLDDAPEAALSGISKFDIHKDTLYCYSSSDNGGVVKAFDLTGKYLFSINKMGHAANEWLFATDFRIDKKRDELLFIDNRTRKIVVTDLQGNSLYTIRCEITLLDEAVRLGNGDIVIPSSFRFTSEEENDYNRNKLHFLNPQGELLTTKIKAPFKDQFSGMGYCNDVNSTSDFGALYSPLLGDVIYQISPTAEVSPLYSFNYLGHKKVVTDKNRDEVISGRLVRRDSPSEYFFFEGHCVDSQEYLYLRFGTDTRPTDVFYHKESGRVVCTELAPGYAIESENGTLNGTPYVAPTLSYGGYWWGELSLMDIFPPDFVVQAMEAPKGLYKELRERVPIESAGVLVRYKIKEPI